MGIVMLLSYVWKIGKTTDDNRLYMLRAIWELARSADSAAPFADPLIARQSEDCATDETRNLWMCALCRSPECAFSVSRHYRDTRFNMILLILIK